MDISSKYLTAKLVHFNSGPVIEASTKEWAIKKHLFKTNDTSAYVNLAKVCVWECLRFRNMCYKTLKILTGFCTQMPYVWYDRDEV